MMNAILSVRNHGGIPDIEEDAFELEIGGLVNKPVKLSMKELKDASRFPYVYMPPCSCGFVLITHLFQTGRDNCYAAV